MNRLDIDSIRLFGDYMKLTGTPSLQIEKGKIPSLVGKKLGVVNGSSWVSLWSTYFGRKMLPGVKVINVGNEGVQLNFMEAHQNGESCPPQINIDLFCNYAEDLYKLYHVDAILISCSTMNRAFTRVSGHMKKFGVPVIQIDQAMMEKAVSFEGKILIIATHGPTVESTKKLLQETAGTLNKKVNFAGATIEDAFQLLGEGKIKEHNSLIADTIKKTMRKEKIDVVVLAQLSMSVFTFSYSDPVSTFGVPVLNSGETGFHKAGEILGAL